MVATVPSPLLSIANPRRAPRSDQLATSIAPSRTSFGSAITPASEVQSTDRIATGSVVRHRTPTSHAGVLASNRSDHQPS